MATTKRIQTISFLVMLLVALGIVLLIVKPFFSLIALAFIIAVLFNPVYRRLLKHLKNQTFSAFITLFIILAIIAIPVWMFGQVAYNEANQLYTQVKSGELVIDRGQIIASVPAPLHNVIENFSRNLNNFIAQFTENAFSSVSSIISNVANFIVSFTMVFFLVFFLLRDGDKIKAVFMDISPIAANQELALFQRIISAVNGVVKGQFLVALCQGAVATVGFILFGVPQPLLWGLFTVLSALIPFVGTALSVVPAIIYLFITGHTPQAIGLSALEIFGIGSIDNLVAPRLVAGSLKLHPALVLIAVVGGIKLFGVLGFLIGPIIMAVFVELVDMYRADFKNHLKV